MISIKAFRHRRVRLVLVVLPAAVWCGGHIGLAALPWPVDWDGDGVLDSLEHRYPGPGQSSSWLADTDADGLVDGQEDANGNGARDAGETSTSDRDSDDDGLVDGMEVLFLRSDPLSRCGANAYADDDRDGLPSMLDPNDGNPDSDGDRMVDGYEILALRPDQRPCPNWTQSPAENALVRPGLGDLNLDGNVTSVDALALQAAFLGNLPYPNASFYMSSADLNGDGFVTSLDALLVQSNFLNKPFVIPVMPYAQHPINGVECGPDVMIEARYVSGSPCVDRYVEAALTVTGYSGPPIARFGFVLTPPAPNRWSLVSARVGRDGFDGQVISFTTSLGLTVSGFSPASTLVNGELCVLRFELTAPYDGQPLFTLRDHFSHPLATLELQPIEHGFDTSTLAVSCSNSAPAVSSPFFPFHVLALGRELTDLYYDVDPNDISPTVNYWPTLSADGLEVFLGARATRPGLGYYDDLFTSRRATTQARWPRPTRLELEPSSAAFGNPVLSADGLTLYFSYRFTRERPKVLRRLYRSARNVGFTLNGALPVGLLGTTSLTPYCLSGDGQWLYVASEAGCNPGSVTYFGRYDLSYLRSYEQPRLVPAAAGAYGTVTSNGLQMVYQKDNYLWVASRTSEDAPFANDWRLDNLGPGAMRLVWNADMSVMILSLSTKMYEVYLP